MVSVTPKTGVVDWSPVHNATRISPPFFPPNVAPPSSDPAAQVNAAELAAKKRKRVNTEAHQEARAAAPEEKVAHVRANDTAARRKARAIVSPSTKDKQREKDRLAKAAKVKLNPDQAHQFDWLVALESLYKNSHTFRGLYPLIRDWADEVVDNRKGELRAELISTAEIVDHIHSQIVSEDAALDLGMQMQERLSVEERFGCASCGIGLRKLDVHAAHLGTLDCLKEEFCRDRVRPGAASGEKYLTRTVCPTGVGPVNYLLYPRFVVMNDDRSEVETVYLCEACHSATRKEKVPSHSLAAGYDYGNLSELPQLYAHERMILSTVVLFRQTLKVSPSHDFKRLQGQIVCFDHSMLSSLLDRCNDREKVAPVKLADVLNVVFVGKQEHWIKYRGKTSLRLTQMLKMRAGVIRQWANALREMNPARAHLFADYASADVDALQEDLDAQVNEVVQGMENISDELVVAANDSVGADGSRRDKPGAFMSTKDVGAGVASDNAGEASDVAGEASHIDCALSDLEEADCASDRVSTQSAHANVMAAEGVPDPAAEPAEPDEDELLDKKEMTLDDLPAAALLPDPRHGVSAEQLFARGLVSVLTDVREALPPLANGEPDGSGSASRSVPNGGAQVSEPVEYSISGAPVNEFTNNGQLLSGLFVSLFPFGLPADCNGPLPESFTRMLMCHHSRRFGRVTDLLFLLFNQKQRHAACRDVAARIKADEGAWNEIATLLVDPTFQAEIEALAQTGKSAPGSRGQQLLAKIMPLVRASASTVPFGPGERSASAAMIISMAQRFNCPLAMVTVAPGERDSVLAVRIAYGGDNDPAAEFKVPNYAARASMASRDPAAVAEYFELVVETVLELAFGLKPADTIKQAHPDIEHRAAGLFGTPLGYFVVFEEQGRMTLHLHALVWAGPDPAAVLKGQHIAAVQAKLTEYLESIVCANISDIAEYSSPEDAGRFFRTYRPADDPSRCTDLPKEEFAHAWKKAVPCQLHNHTFTCEHGRFGCTECRLAYPQNQFHRRTRMIQVHRDTSIEQPVRFIPRHEQALSSEKKKLAAADLGRAVDEREIIPDFHGVPYHTEELYATMTVDASATPDEILHSMPIFEGSRVYALQRNAKIDERVVPFNKTLTSVTMSNTSVDLIIGLWAVIQYLAPYMTKEGNTTHKDEAARLFLSAMVEVRNRDSVADDAGTDSRTAKQLVTRIVNAMSGKQVVGAETCAFALLGHRSYMASEKFQYAFVWPAMAECQKNTAALAAAGRLPDINQVFSHSQERDEDARAGWDWQAEADLLGPRDYDEDFDEDDVEEVVDFLADSANAAKQLFGDASKSSSTATKIPYKVPNGDGGHRLEFLAQHDLYRWRGDSQVSQLCLHEWVSLASVRVATEGEIEKLLDNASNSVSDPAVGRGRKKNAVALFHPSCPLASTHVQALRSQPRCVTLAGVPPPQMPRTAKQEARRGVQLAEYMCSLFYPWDVETGALPFQPTLVNFRRMLCDFSARTPSFYAERVRLIYNILAVGRVPAAAALISGNWRRRHADRWGENGIKRPTGGTGPASGRGSADADAVTERRLIISELISQLQHQSKEPEDAAAAFARQRSQVVQELLRVGCGTANGPDVHGRPPAPPSFAGVDRFGIANDDFICQQKELEAELRLLGGAGGGNDAAEPPAKASTEPSSAEGEPKEVEDPLLKCNFEFDFSDELLADWTKEQVDLMQRMLEWGRALQAWVRSKHKGPAPKPVQVLIHGAGGTGKSHVALEFAKRCPAHVLKIAPTGKSAVNIRGMTYHFGLKTYTNDPVVLEGVEKLMRDIICVILDEGSMAGAEQFSIIVRRLTAYASSKYQDPETPAFGGLGFICLADFHQKTPVMDRSLCECSILYLASQHLPAGKAPTLLPKYVEGTRAFVGLQKLEFVTQKRAAGDAELARLHASLRDITKEQVFTDDDIRMLTARTINPSNAARPEWKRFREGPIITPRNATIDLINRECVTDFARGAGVPVLSWTSHVPNATPQVLELLAAKVAALHVYVAIGCRLALNKNQKESRNADMVNGLNCILVALIYNHEEMRSRVSALIQAATPGEEVEIPMPDALVVRVTVVREDKTTHSFNVRLEQGKVDKVKVLRKNIVVNGFQLAAGYAMTDYKVQSLTLPACTLDFSMPPGAGAKWGYDGAYVGLSRVKMLIDLFILCNSIDGQPPDLSFLKKLRMPDWLRNWHLLYDDDGMISIDRFKELDFFNKVPRKRLPQKRAPSGPANKPKVAAKKPKVAALKGGTARVPIRVPDDTAAKRRRVGKTQQQQAAAGAAASSRFLSWSPVRWNGGPGGCVDVTNISFTNTCPVDTAINTVAAACLWSDRVAAVLAAEHPALFDLQNRVRTGGELARQRVEFMASMFLSDTRAALGCHTRPDRSRSRGRHPQSERWNVTLDSEWLCWLQLAPHAAAVTIDGPLQRTSLTSLRWHDWKRCATSLHSNKYPHFAEVDRTTVFCSPGRNVDGVLVAPAYPGQHAQGMLALAWADTLSPIHTNGRCSELFRPDSINGAALAALPNDFTGDESQIQSHELDPVAACNLITYVGQNNLANGEQSFVLRCGAPCTIVQTLDAFPPLIVVATGGDAVPLRRYAAYHAEPLEVELTAQVATGDLNSAVTTVATYVLTAVAHHKQGAGSTDHWITHVRTTDNLWYAVDGMAYEGKGIVVGDRQIRHMFQPAAASITVYLVYALRDLSPEANP